jgi:hypothetical protein
MTLVLALLASFLTQATPAPGCAVTEMVRATPPQPRDAGGLGESLWWVSADRSIWLKSWTGPWHVGYNQKNMMLKPSGITPTISGTRIDASAPPMEVRWVPQRGDLQTMGLTFPTDGCWKITATAGDHKLEFVTHVRLQP